MNVTPEASRPSFATETVLAATSTALPLVATECPAAVTGSIPSAIGLRNLVVRNSA